MLRGRWQLLSRSCATLSALLFVLFLLFGGRFLRHEHRLQSELRSGAGRLSDSLAEEIAARLRRIEGLGAELAEALAAGELDHDGESRRLREILYLNPDLAEIGIAFAPFTHDPAIRLHGVAFALRQGELERLDLDEREDYVRGDTPWWERPRSVGAGWLEPRFERGGTRLLVLYALPFTAGAAPAGVEGRGVVYLACSTGGIARLLEEADFGAHGLAALLSRDGAYVYHPDPTLVGRRGAGILGERRGPLRRWLDLVGRGSRGGHRRAIEPAGWTLESSWHAADGAAPPEEARQLLMASLLALYGCIAFLGVPVFRPGRRERSRPWGLAGYFAALSLLCTVGLLWAAWTHQGLDDKERQRIVTRSDLKEFIRYLNSGSVLRRNEVPVYVPTGIYIQSITFLTANEVRLTGYVWQRYRDGEHDGVSRGFIMPASESAEITDAYSVRDGDTELRAWNFKVVLHQKFDYSRFPIGQENVWVQLWHQDFQQNVILTPDLDGYKLANPETLPGLAGPDSLDIPGWSIERSSFSYVRQSYDTDFGMRDYTGLTEFPELYFNILIRKEIIGPVVSHLLPISVVIVMLFTILMLADRRDQKTGLLGFNTMNVVAACAGFFLVVIFLHIDLRESLAADQIIYLELFYFLTYVVILGVAVNALLFATREVADNRVPQLLYWPLTQVALLVMTLLSFYR